MPIYNTLYQSTYCICAPTRKIYLQFFKDLVNKYLTDSKNYHIYVSTTDIFLPLYKTEWPTHPRLIYVTEGLIPTFPNNINIIYFYHQMAKPTKNEQIALVDYIDSMPLVKYVYIGSAGNLLSSVRTKLFKYFLYFEVTKSRWGRSRIGGIIDYRYSRSINRHYYSQQQRKTKATGNVTIYDYFLFHDNFLEETKIVKFNKKIIKKKKPVPKPVQLTTVVATPQVVPESKIKYVFTGIRPNTNCLIMPNGSRENYNDVVNKYSDIIEV